MPHDEVLATRTDVSMLRGPHLLLRPLREEDVTATYVHWLNDPAVNAFLESRFTVHTLASVRAYVQQRRCDASTIFFAICTSDTGEHIGNIKCDPIDWHHRIGDVGFMIGTQAAWGKGYATEAVHLFVDYLFTAVQLHKITAGAYASNVGSIRVLERNGFRIEAVRKQHVHYEGQWTDVVLLAKWAPGQEPAAG